MPKILQTY